jgi:hypothetical protein
LRYRVMQADDTRVQGGPSRLSKAIAVLGIALAAPALAVALTVDRVGGEVHSFSRNTIGRPAYAGVWAVWVDVPHRVPIACAAVAVTALAVTLLRNGLPRFRRWVVALLSTGSLVLLVWLGGLLAAYAEVRTPSWF